MGSPVMTVTSGPASSAGDGEGLAELEDEGERLALALLEALELGETEADGLTDGLMLWLGDTEALAEGETEGDIDGLTLELLPPRLGLGDGLTDELGLVLADGDTDGETLDDGESDAEGLTLGLILADGETEADGDTEALAECDGETDALGETLALADDDGDTDALGLTLAEGLSDGDGEADGDMLADGLTDGLTEDDPTLAGAIAKEIKPVGAADSVVWIVKGPAVPSAAALSKMPMKPSPAV